MMNAIQEQQKNLDKKVTKLMKRFPILSCLIMGFLTPMLMLLSVGVITVAVVLPISLLFDWI